MMKNNDTLQNRTHAVTPANAELLFGDKAEVLIEAYFSHLGKTKPRKLHQTLLQRMELAMIKKVMQKSNFNYTVSAKWLGISRPTLYRKIEQYGLSAWIKFNIKNNH